MNSLHILFGAGIPLTALSLYCWWIQAPDRNVRESEQFWVRLDSIPDDRRNR